MFDSQAFIKLHPDDFDFCIQLLEAKLIKIKEEYRKYKTLIENYNEKEKQKSIIRQIWETFSFQNFTDYHDYLWYEEEIDILNAKKQKVESMLNWFSELNHPIYISIDDYKFILKEDNI